MNYKGIIIGAAVFLSIGICHPLVIKMEYYWGRKSWWIWLVAGLAFCALSLFVRNDIVSFIALGTHRRNPLSQAGLYGHRPLHRL